MPPRAGYVEGARGGQGPKNKSNNNNKKPLREKVASGSSPLGGRKHGPFSAGGRHHSARPLAAAVIPLTAAAAEERPCPSESGAARGGGEAASEESGPATHFLCHGVKDGQACWRSRRSSSKKGPMTHFSAGPPRALFRLPAASVSPAARAAFCRRRNKNSDARAGTPPRRPAICPARNVP